MLIWSLEDVLNKVENHYSNQRETQITTCR